MFRIQTRLHPTLDILVSSVGAVMLPKSGSHAAHWTFGANGPKSAEGERYKTVKVNKHSSTVHRLVAETFLPNPNNYKQVDHRDRHPSNNSVVNLRWVDASLNQLNTIASDSCMQKYGLHSSENKAEYQRRYRATPEGKARIKNYNQRYQAKRSLICESR